MPFTQSAITKYRKKWFHFKSRAGSPTISHFDEVGTLHIPIDPDHTSVEYPDLDYIQCNETSTTIFSLPTELLATIFLYCTRARQLMIFDPSQAPINLTQTCQLWRDVAVGTPQLWNRLLPTHQTPIDMMELWLSRTRHYPLVLNLTCMDFAMSRNLIRQEKLLAILSNYNSRVTELSLSARIPRSIILWMEPSNFPRLSSVHWSCGGSSATDPDTIKSFEHFWSIAGSIPSLQSVTINRIPPVGPWNQITQLRLSFSSFAKTPTYESLQALAQCAQLRKLHWSIDRPDSGTTFFPPIVIPKLNHLTLHFRDKLDQCPILNSLIVPNIHHISIFVRDGHPAMLKSLTRLLHHSNARLRSFELHGLVHDEQASLIPFFQEPCLKTLRQVVIGECSMLEVWAAFSQATLLPSLETLRLGVNRDLAIDNVLSYLETRERQDTKLASVVLFVYCICNIDSMEVRNAPHGYHGCRELHPPWNTVRQKLQLCMNVEVVPWGDLPSFCYGDNNKV